MAGMIGQRVGGYEITGLLGEGGMATVYRARQESVGRDVAVKIIESKLARSQEFIRRFDREARTIAGLSHPYILKLFDYGRQDDLLYLVMELLPGGSLAALIKRRPLELAEAARLLDQIASALDYAHGLGIIHRDLKPQNVLLDMQGNAILTDFGVAKILNETTALTQSGIAMGTPSYMPPEQWQNLALDARADVYALGIMLFEMLTGRLPFEADTPLQMMYAHMNEHPRPARDLRADLPEAVERVIAKALTKRLDDRFQTAGALAIAFRTAISGIIPPGLEQAPTVFAGVPDVDRTSRTPVGTVGAPPRKTPPGTLPAEDAVGQPASRRRGAGLIALGALAFLLVIGGLALLAGRGGGESPTLSPAPNTTVPAVVVLPSATPSSSETPVPSATFSETPPPSATHTATFTTTSTELPTATPSATTTATFTPSDTATFTATPLPTETPTLTPIPSDTPNLETLVFQLAVTETLNAQQTIDAYTDTPSPTPTETPDQLGTARAILRLTQTAIAAASATRTPTPTPRPTITPTPAPTSMPVFPAGSSNRAWSPIRDEFGGVPMMLVPPGCFMMGDTDIGPINQVCFEQPFWIDQYEVSNGQFADIGGKAERPSSWTDSSLPRETINWFEARAFCEARGARLPSEAEWEYAARGPESWVYPWGNEFDADRAVYSENSNSKTAPIASYPNGASWVGAQHMAGNVWEWTNSILRDYPYKAGDGRESSVDSTSSRVPRGGSYGFEANLIRSAYRVSENPESVHHSGLGFRCARDFDSASPLPPPAATEEATPDLIAEMPFYKAGSPNAGWTPLERPIGSVRMALVPPGCFRMGSQDGESDEQPVSEICIDRPFWIDIYEVSRQEFNDFDGKADKAQTADLTLPRGDLTWMESHDYCTLRGGRLPTEAEWEYAARGPEGWIYPWGNTFVGANAVYTGSGVGIQPIGSRPGGASWVGAQDMAGNVWEWVSSLYRNYPYNAGDGRESLAEDAGKRVFRGGAYDWAEDGLRGAQRLGIDAGYTHPGVGLRCVRDFNGEIGLGAPEATPVVGQIMVDSADQVELLLTLSGHTGGVRSAVFGPDGSWIATASGDNTVMVWDAVTGKTLHTLKGHDQWLEDIAASPTGLLIASASGDKTIKLWTPRTGKLVRTLSAETEAFWSVAFSPDGSLIAGGSFDNLVKLWNAEDGALRLTLTGHTAGVEGVAFSPNRAILASGAWDKTVKVWELFAGDLIMTLTGHTNSVHHVTFSPDGAWIASASEDQTVRIWDASSGALIRTLKGHTAGVWRVAFSPDGTLIASAGMDGTVRLWDAATGDLLHTLKEHTANHVQSVIFSSDGRFLLSAGEDSTARVWGIKLK